MKSMTILYKVYQNLYVNMTNQCPCSCVFCLRQGRDSMEDSGSLWLEHEPTVDEVIAELDKFQLSDYKELVFCGFGEPTQRLEDMLQVCKYVKEHFKIPIRVNTNGLADLIHEKDTAPLFSGLVDTISISLNTPNPKRFYELTRSKFGLPSFDAMIRFAKNVKKYVPNVIMSTVETTLTKEEEEQCAQICKEIGVTYRIRKWED